MGTKGMFRSWELKLKGHSIVFRGTKHRSLKLKMSLAAERVESRFLTVALPSKPRVKHGTRHR